MSPLSKSTVSCECVCYQVGGVLLAGLTLGHPSTVRRHQLLVVALGLHHGTTGAVAPTANSQCINNHYTPLEGEARVCSFTKYGSISYLLWCNQYNLTPVCGIENIFSLIDTLSSFLAQL